jgi:hypothetical protein
MMSANDPINTYGTIAAYLQVLLEYNGGNMFTLTIHDLPGSLTAILPVAWVVHFDGQALLFTEGQTDYGRRLENLAESGDVSLVGSYLTM